MTTLFPSSITFFMSTPFHNEASSLLSSLSSSGLFRSLFPVISRHGPVLETPSGSLVSFAGNDYLGLSLHPDILSSFCNSASIYGLGSSSSRLVSGSHEPHLLFEDSFSIFKGMESSLLFSSGFLANLAALTVFPDSDTYIFSDERNHASIIDGCRLSGARISIYRHLDTCHLEELLSSSPPDSKKLVVTDSVFSTDGAIAPLSKISSLCEKYCFLFVVDEAHSTGVMGPGGSGLCSSLPIHPHIQISTLSKAFGLSGGLISCSRLFRDLIVNKGRSFIFTTAPPPPLSSAASVALDLISSSTGDKLRKRLFSNVQSLHSSLLDLGLRVNCYSHIISIRVGDPAVSVNASKFLLDRGLFILPFRPPTVPPGKSLLRIVPSAVHDSIHLDHVVDAFSSMKNKPDFKNIFK